MSEVELNSTAMPKVLAVASAGGHWQQLMQIAESFSGFSVVFACTKNEVCSLEGHHNVIIIRDHNRNTPLAVVIGIWQAFRLVRNVDPDLVISTGAAPGLVCLCWARLLGKRTVWLDSIANSEKISLSGQIALKFADVTLTQWEHLARQRGPKFLGSVL